MEAKIRRGRVLREILKQERLAPLTIEFQLAWLVAFNDGLLDALDPESIPDRLERLAARVADSELTLDDDHETWGRAVAGWLALDEDATP